MGTKAGLLSAVAGVTGIGGIGGFAGTAAADAPYRDGPLAAGASGSALPWSSAISPNADEFLALVCLMLLLVGFRWAGLAQRDRMSR